MRTYLELRLQKGWNRLMIRSLFFSLFLALSPMAFAQLASAQLAEEQDFVFASSLFKDGVYQLAAEQFAKFLKKYPTSLKLADAAFLKCECSFQSGQYAEAAAGFSRFVKEHPSSPLTADGFFRIGESNLKLKRPSEAIAAFKVVTDRFGERDLAGEAAYWIGEAYIKSDDQNNALKYYSLAYENYPKNKLRDYALYSMGWTYQHKSDFAKGVEFYRRLITEFPESKLSASAKVRIGECLFYSKDYKNAIEELSKMRASILEPAEQGDADYLIAEAHYQIGEYSVAQSKYQAFLSAHPDHKLVREVLYALGWTLLKQKEYQKAATTFNKLVDGADALAHSGLFRRGTAEKLAGNTAAALTTFADVVQRSPQGEFSDNALYESGLISFEGKKTIEARNYFLRVVGEHSASDVFAESEWMLGECFLVESSFKDAHGWFSKAAAHPNASFEVKVNARYQAAWCLYKMKDYTASVSALKSFVGDFPKHPNAVKGRFWLAESEYQRGNYKEAQEAYRPLVEEPGEKQEEAMYGMGWSHFKMGQFDKAVDSFEKLVALFPKGKMVFDARLRLADAYFSQKDYKKAVSSYRTVIRTYPTNESVDYAHYQLAQAMLKQGNNAEAYQQFSELIRVFPKSNLADDAQYALGWINFQKKEYLEAVKEFQKLVSGFPNSELLPKGHYSMGDSYYNLEQFKAAEKSYREVVQQFPKSSYVVDAVTGIQHCLVAQGKSSQAVSVVDEYAKENANSSVGEELLLKKAELLFVEKKYPEAMKEYKSFTEKFPSSPNVAAAFYGLGKSLEAQDELTGAALTFEQAAGAQKASPQIASESMLKAIQIYSRLKKYDRAFDLMGKFEKDFKDAEVAPDAAYLKAVLFSENENHEEAKRQYESLVMRHPSSFAADKGRVALARMYLAGKNASAARDLAEKVASSRTDEYGAEAQFLTAEALAASSQWEEAVTAYLRVRYLFSSYDKWVAKSYLGLGASYEAMNDLREAKKAYQNVLRYKEQQDSVSEAQIRLKKLERS